LPEPSSSAAIPSSGDDRSRASWTGHVPNLSQMLGVLGVLLYFSYAYLHFYNVGLTSVAPVHWYLLTLGLAPVALAQDKYAARSIARARPLLIWAGATTFVFSVSYAITAAGRSEYDDPLQEFITEEEMVLLLAVFGIIYQSAATLKLATTVLIGATLFGTAMNIGEFASGEAIFSNVAGRAAGLYENSNVSGEMIVAGMLLSILRLPLALRVPYSLVVGVGVLVTFSRSAMLLWTAAFVGMVMFGWLTRHRKVALAAALIGLAAASQSLMTGGLVDAVEALGAGDLLNANTRARIGSSFLDQQDFSKKEREDVALRAFEDWRDAPIMGNGIGYSGHNSVQPHNQYLKIASDMGFVGLALVLVLLCLLLRSGTVGVLIAVQLFVSNFFSHNNLDSPPVQVAVAMALSVAWKEMSSFKSAVRPA
jgi:hypothetical protein